MSAYEQGLTDVDPITEARGMDALARARASRIRVSDTLHESPTRAFIGSRFATGEINRSLVYDSVDQEATGLYGLEPAVEMARARIALDGATNQSEFEVAAALPAHPTHPGCYGTSILFHPLPIIGKIASCVVSTLLVLTPTPTLFVRLIRPRASSTPTPK